ncbi:hypothetical protein Syun_025781 [Stephania yunnanensis]|uniref:L-ascorbate peroxidase n=1 Tax=Stephania yunnanensis TaxID=152371 RepID=A0AAP0ESB6_9MAGN
MVTIGARSAINGSLDEAATVVSVKRRNDEVLRAFAQLSSGLNVYLMALINVLFTSLEIKAITKPYFSFKRYFSTSAYPTIQEVLRKALTKRKATDLLRLAFHDEGTFDADENSGGMNGSIVYELSRPENVRLKKSLKILEKAKSEVDGIKPVSWADMIDVAGAEAVSICGGSFIPIQFGRIDSLVRDPEGKLPKESLSASELKQCFRTKGFSTQELVALSGAHTIGSKGFGSPVVFDNSYYKILLENPWMTSDGMSSMIGLPSDRALSWEGECLSEKKPFGDDDKFCFTDFHDTTVDSESNIGIRMF